MDVEKISNVTANYSSSEAAKVSTAAKPEIASVDIIKAAQTAATTVVQSGKTGDQKEGEDSLFSKKERVPSEATIDDAVKSANRKMEKTRCEYSYHKETNRVSIRVLDADTDEVLREIPPEKSLDMLQKMWEMAGILVDERR